MDIFCEIAKKISKAEIVYEDDTIMAFKDIDPYSEGHTLIIPKKHYEDILDIPEYELKCIMFKAKEIAEKLAPNFDGVVIQHSSGKLRDINHFHLHVHGMNRKTPKTPVIA